MRILIIGNGGREHALAWKTAQSPLVETIYAAPGNAGTAEEPKVQNVSIDVTDLEGLARFAQKQKIDLCIVGPETPLVLGIRDVFDEINIPCLGPTRRAAQLEASKAFTKAFLERHGIPTAAYRTFTDYGQAVNYIETNPLPMVIKADGLAAGKGVIIAKTRQEALEAIDAMLKHNEFGQSGHRIVVEEFLEGEEASFICLVSGGYILPLASSQDHKARDDGDKGPNTGGMGAYSPAPVVDDHLHKRIMKEIIEPTVAGMALEGHDYEGFLYAGIMVSPSGDPKVLEFNCRFGDPETQPVLMRLKSDFAALCLAAVRKQLDQISLEWDPRVALGVVMASGGYPEHYETGHIIKGLEDCRNLSDTKVFHAGTKNSKNAQTVTSGGRVLCVTSLGETTKAAQKKAYQTTEKITWPQVYFRRDIGYRAVCRE